MLIDEDAAEPIRASVSDAEVEVWLRDGRQIVTPLWWYPTLLRATDEQRNAIELSPFGLHWPDLDEDLSIEGMLKGRRAKNAVPPLQAAE